MFSEKEISGAKGDADAPYHFYAGVKALFDPVISVCAKVLR